MEVYKDVIGYEGIYQVSNLGNVKNNKNGFIRKCCLEKTGYYSIRLYINRLGKTRKVHQLVAEAFLNHKRCGMEFVINHIDFNKTNNKVENLEIITQRENSNKKHLKSTSKYTGVSWSENRNKWISIIRINNKPKYLGLFINEIDASEAYQKALKDL